MKGSAIDIGGYPDPLSLYVHLFPLLEEVKIWDIGDGDAQHMVGVPDDHYDTVHSSHCLEHLNDAAEGLLNWYRILKPGGYLIITVPDEDLYEQGNFPSIFNKDHKWTFTINKLKSWSQKSINILDLVRVLPEMASIEKIQLVDFGYRHNFPQYDQTLTPFTESAIELIVKKKEAKKSVPVQPPQELLRYFNQYRIDNTTMKSGNTSQEPFTDYSPL